MTTSGYRIAVAGATGLVGRTMLKVLAERNFPIQSLKLLASARSAGMTMEHQGTTYTVEELTEHSFTDVDIALFSAGGSTSKTFAPIAARSGAIVIDNSSAWRMHEHVPLVVPEVNAQALHGHHGIIANPNCSTIQLVVALQPLHDAFTLKRVVCSTYQSVSGAGNKGVEALLDEVPNHGAGQQSARSPFAMQAAYNTMFHTIKEIDGFSEEETKMIHETRKIMSLPELRLAMTCVRVPTLGGHAESVNIETEQPITPAKIREVLAQARGIEIMDEPQNNIYPTPLRAHDRDDVFVGHIRPDDSVEHGAYLWVVSDNIRKGAATNAVQIAESLIQHNALAFTPLEKW